MFVLLSDSSIVVAKRIDASYVRAFPFYKAIHEIDGAAESLHYLHTS